MVGVIGAPAERKLGEVARADEQRALLVGGVHKYLRALARLNIFVGHVEYAHIVPYVPHMLSTRGDDVYIPELGPDALRERNGARLRALRGTEAGHCDADYVFLRQAKQVERPVRNKQRKCRIEPARNAYHSLFEPYVLDPLCKPRRLDIEYLGAARTSDIFVGRHERVRVERSVHIILFERRQSYRNASHVPLGIACRIVVKFTVSSQGFELLYIDTGADRRAVPLKAFVFGEYAAVFRNGTRTREHKIRRALADSGGGVDIAAVAPRARLLNKTQPEIILCDHLVGGGDID